MKVTNTFGIEIDFDAAVNLMDADIRETVSSRLAPCEEQEFFEEYCKAHEETYAEEFELAKRNPIW